MGLPCTLKIRAPQFEVALEGDPSFVRLGYDALRNEILKRLRSSPADDPAATASAQLVDTTTDLGPEFVWVNRCNDLYNKVHVVERRELVATGLGRIVDLTRLDRLYVESSQGSALEGLVPEGKTLWSELTALGRRRLRKR